MQPVSDFDLETLYQEAQIRWLKPTEVLFILQNHERCPINPEPPNKPPGGSLFLFNRRVLRFFRKDGHMWRRKKDGRTVGEAHERLKVGNVDALNCYYAHGEQNPYFQRRSYWILDPAFEHIVLVHYREVDEGRYIPGSVSSGPSTSSSLIFSQNISISNTPTQGTSVLNEPHKTSYSSGSVEEVSSKFVSSEDLTDRLDANDISRNSGRPARTNVNQALRMLAEQLSLDKDDNLISVGEKLPPYPTQDTQQGSGLLGYEIVNHTKDPHGEIPHQLQYRDQSYYFDRDAAKQNNSKGTMLLLSTGGNPEKPLQTLGPESADERKGPLSWNDMLDLSSSSTEIDAQERNLTLVPRSIAESSPGRAHAFGKEFPAKDRIQFENDMPLSSSGGGARPTSLYGEPENSLLQQPDYRGNSEENWPSACQVSDLNLQLQISATREFLLGPENFESPMSASVIQEAEEPIHYSGTNSSNDSSFVGTLGKENSVDWMRSMDPTVDSNSYSANYLELFDGNQFGMLPVADSSLTVAQKQWFSIREISPEWAFSSGNTKVIITGDFLCNPSECSWAAMFGDKEVRLEIIQEGVLRCQAPPHVAGKVTLCITCGNRESCSEVREFEYCVKPETSSSENNLKVVAATKCSEELLLLTKFVQTLLCGCDTASVQKDANVELEIDPLRKLKGTNDQWGQVIDSLSFGDGSPLSTIDWLLQELLKDRLQQWLSSKCQENKDGNCSLSKLEQGIIHMISGLGYEWALSSILNCGVGVNFRDLNGWTALHWAACFGREKMVAALLAAGASAGAVTDPCVQDPIGQTPASVAAASGHKGLAGYLSEVALTSHLSSLTMEEVEISKGSAELEAERAVENIYQRSIQIHAGATEDQLSLKDSLAAVRNAAQAAARIQSAFRAHSFRKKHQRSAESHDEYDMTPAEIHGLSAASRLFHGHRDQKYNTAALCIQRKYRGWKGRKNFLTLRQHVVKIQAHVRGHQVRKKYKEFIWTVSVVEKAILRWRRRGVGLRGFRAELEPIDETEDDDILKAFRKQKVDVAVDEAFSRVLSIVESPGARQQYRRMLERYRQAKAEVDNASEATSSVQSDYQNDYIDDEDIYQLTLDEPWSRLGSPT